MEPKELDWGEAAHPEVLPDIEACVPALLALFRTDYADREIMVHDHRRFTYREIEEASAHLAGQLIEAGISKGSQIGLLLPDDERFLISWLAATRIGCVAVALSTLVISPLKAFLALKSTRRLKPVFQRAELVPRLTC